MLENLAALNEKLGIQSDGPLDLTCKKSTYVARKGKKGIATVHLRFRIKTDKVTWVVRCIACFLEGWWGTRIKEWSLDALKASTPVPKSRKEGVGDGRAEGRCFTP